MKIICLSDVHLTSSNPVGRKDNLTVAQWNKLRFVLSYAKKHDAIVVQAGDFFNRARDWNVLYKMIEMLRKFSVPVLSIFGQHDQYFRSSTSNNATTMGILAGLGLITLLHSDRRTSYGGVDIYGCHWGEKLPAIEVDKDRKNMLVIHAPISPEKLFPKHLIIKPKKMLKRYRQFDLILCGDVHRHFFYAIDDRYLINTGPMLRMEAIEYNFRHIPNFFVYDKDRLKKIKEVVIPHKPADDALTRTHIDDEQVFINEEKLDILAQAVKQRFGKVSKINIPRLIEKHKFSKRMRKVISELYKDATE